MAEKNKKSKRALGRPSSALVRRLMAGGAACFMLAMVATTAWFVWKTLQDVDAVKNNDVSGSVRVESVDTTLLDKTLKKNADRVSDDRRAPDQIADPFRNPASEKVAPTPAPAPVFEVPPTETPTEPISTPEEVPVTTTP